MHLANAFYCFQSCFVYKSTASVSITLSRHAVDLSEVVVPVFVGSVPWLISKLLKSLLHEAPGRALWSAIVRVEAGRTSIDLRPTWDRRRSRSPRGPTGLKRWRQLTTEGETTSITMKRRIFKREEDVDAAAGDADVGEEDAEVLVVPAIPAGVSNSARRWNGWHWARTI